MASTTESIREQLVKAKRPRRTPVDAEFRDRLNIPGLDQENYVYRWVNDREERILDLLERGYEFVSNKTLKPVGDKTIDSAKQDSSIFTQRMGQGVTGYLMAIPKEFHLEDSKVRQKRIDDLEEAMVREANQEGRYGKVEISRRR